MTSKIILKKSSVASKVPVVGDLDFGELALNYEDGKLFYKKSNNTIQQLNAAGSGSGTVTSVAALTIGTTGTDLGSTVADSTTTPVITLNVPTASASARGALSSADWSTFSGKQALLVSGTNIKTVNGTSLLGSGDLVVSGGSGGLTIGLALALASGNILP